jgi:hypothetical protein
MISGFRSMSWATIALESTVAMAAATNEKYSVTTQVGRYGNKWVVTRLADGKIMTENHDPRVCLRWVRAWGDKDLGR